MTKKDQSIERLNRIIRELREKKPELFPEDIPDHVLTAFLEHQSKRITHDRPLFEHKRIMPCEPYFLIYSDKKMYVLLDFYPKEQNPDNVLILESGEGAQDFEKLIEEIGSVLEMDISGMKRKMFYFKKMPDLEH